MWSSPRRSAGPRSGTLSIGDDAADSPQTVALTGRGVSTVTFSAPTIAFPDQRVGTTSAPEYVTLTNNAETALTIRDLQSTGDDSQFAGNLGTCGGQLAAHGSCQVGAAFAPTVVGSHSATLLVEDSAPDSPQQVALTGTGVESVTLSPRAITFPDQHVGTISVPEHVTFTNVGDSPLDLRALDSTSDEFAGDIGTCPLRIEPHTSCDLAVTFTPTGLGPRSGTLSIYFDSSPESPEQIALTGTGVGWPATADLSANLIDFGDVLLGGGTTDQTVTLTNKGEVPLTIDRLAITGDRDFGDVIHCGAPPAVPPGGSCQVGANFVPKAGGVRTATILVYDNAADSPQQITVTGRGVAPPGAPTIDSVTAGDGSATVAFTPPADDGGTPITGYTITSNPGLAAATGTQSPITVTGLQNGTSYTFQVIAVNSVAFGVPSAASAPVTPAAPLAVTSASPLPTATVGHAYTTALTATGGIAPLAWSLTPGDALPAGLTLHPDGTITGTPTTARASSFTVRVSDAATPAHTATKTLALTVAPAPPAQADLAVSVSHVGRFVSGWLGWYRFSVTNTGGAATTGATTVSASLPRGLTPIWTAASGWACHGHGQTGTCTHAGRLAAHTTSSILVLVFVTAPAGQWLSTTAAVTPTDATPADNTATDRVQVQRH